MPRLIIRPTGDPPEDNAAFFEIENVGGGVACDISYICPDPYEIISEKTTE